MVDKLIKEIEDRMVKTVEATAHELAKLRTGKATTALLDGIKVDYYGTELPLNQIAGIAVPEARLIVISPWDKNAINAIVKGIQTSDLGLPPQSDGNVVRISIPPLTEERRKDLTKVAGKIAEEGKISVRNIRREAVDRIKKGQNDGDIPEDMAKKSTEDVQKKTDESIEKIETLRKKKEEEILKI